MAPERMKRMTIRGAIQKLRMKVKEVLSFPSFLIVHTVISENPRNAAY